mgnify:FL=1
MTLVEVVAARLRAHVTSRTVFEFAVPDGPLPTAYLLVRATPASERATRMTDTTDHVMWTVRVLSVARHVDPFKAARTADVGSSMARTALRDYRPLLGPWRMRFELSADAYRDESLPETTFVAAIQYAVRTSLN